MNNNIISQKLKNISIIIIGITLIACVLFTLSLLTITVHYKLGALFFFGYTSLVIAVSALFIILSIIIYAQSEILKNSNSK